MKILQKKIKNKKKIYNVYIQWEKKKQCLFILFLLFYFFTLLSIYYYPSTKN